MDLTELDTSALEFLSQRELLRAFLYLAGPPISNDDLKTVAEIRSLNPSKLREDPEAVCRIVDVVRVALDRRRFPWVVEGRDPTDLERNAALLASTALMAVARVSTQRRSESNTIQEGYVAETLMGAGLAEVPRREIHTLVDAPDPGQFCRESLAGTEKADFVVRLYDDRVMLIECKVSNSAVNSVKRLNHEAVGKAEKWLKDFGARQIVPVAVISGVYKLHNLQNAQDRGLTLFWAHDLSALTDWIARTR